MQRGTKGDLRKNLFVDEPENEEDLVILSFGQDKGCCQYGEF